MLAAAYSTSEADDETEALFRVMHERLAAVGSGPPAPLSSIAALTRSQKIPGVCGVVVKVVAVNRHSAAEDDDALVILGDRGGGRVTCAVHAAAIAANPAVVALGTGVVLRDVSALCIGPRSVVVTICVENIITLFGLSPAASDDGAAIMLPPLHSDETIKNPACGGSNPRGFDRMVAPASAPTATAAMGGVAAAASHLEPLQSLVRPSAPTYNTQQMIAPVASACALGPTTLVPPRVPDAGTMAAAGATMAPPLDSARGVSSAHPAFGITTTPHAAAAGVTKQQQKPIGSTLAQQLEDVLLGAAAQEAPRVAGVRSGGKAEVPSFSQLRHPSSNGLVLGGAAAAARSGGNDVSVVGSDRGTELDRRRPRDDASASRMPRSSASPFIQSSGVSAAATGVPPRCEPCVTSPLHTEGEFDDFASNDDFAPPHQPTSTTSRPTPTPPTAAPLPPSSVVAAPGTSTNVGRFGSFGAFRSAASVAASTAATAPATPPALPPPPPPQPAVGSSHLVRPAAHVPGATLGMASPRGTSTSMTGIVSGGGLGGLGGTGGGGGGLLAAFRHVVLPHATGAPSTAAAASTTVAAATAVPPPTGVTMTPSSHFSFSGGAQTRADHRDAFDDDFMTE